METSLWGKFLAIIGFIGCGLLVLLALFMGTTFASLTGSLGVMAGMSGGTLLVIYLALAVLYFFPCFYLYNFSVKMQRALLNNDQLYLQTAFAHLKSCYKFIGILTIVLLSIYILTFAVGVFFAFSMGS